MPDRRDLLPPQSPPPELQVSIPMRSVQPVIDALKFALNHLLRQHLHLVKDLPLDSLPPETELSRSINHLEALAREIRLTQARGRNRAYRSRPKSNLTLVQDQLP